MELNAEARVTIARPREQVWAVVVDVETIPRVWKGRGAIPGTLKAEVVGGGPLTLDGVRRVHNTDGSVVDERIVELTVPSRQAYVLEKGLKVPFTLLVKKARGEWTLTESGGSTELVWLYRFFLTTPLVAPLARGVARSFGKAMQQGLDRLKQHIESP